MRIKRSASTHRVVEDHQAHALPQTLLQIRLVIESVSGCEAVVARTADVQLIFLSLGVQCSQT